MDNPAIIVASISGILSLITSIVVAALEIKRTKESVKPATEEATAKIIEMALNLNKQEFETIRITNENLKAENKAIQDENKKMRDEIAVLRDKIEELEQKYDDCLKKETN